MKSLIYSILVGCILCATSCGKHDPISRSHNSYRLETQVVSTVGTLSILSVVSISDTKGTMTIEEGHSQVTFSYGNGNDVVIDSSQISVQGKIWGEIAAGTKQVLINYYDNIFTVQLDPKE